MRSFSMASFLLGILAALLVLAAAGLIVVYTGAYNVAATSGHVPIARWALDTTMHNSVESRAGELEPPPVTPAMLRAGAAEYKEYCEHCHGGPGASRAEWARGMLPMPPHLSHAARDWSPAEIFWIVKHGIKMSGMPSFAGEGDETIWAIAAFVNRMPAITPEAYAAVGGGGHDH